MLLSINSNIVSGVFSAAEVLLFLLLTNIILRVAYYHNIRVLYSLRRPLHLCPPQLPIFVPSPLTSPNLSRLSAFLLVLCLFLLTSASFSFVGESQTVYRPQKVPYLLTAAKNDFVDYRRHITPTGNLTSLFFNIASDNPCDSTFNNQEITYEQFIDIPGDINDVKWPYRPTRLRNFTCLTPNSGYQPRRINTYRDVDISLQERLVPCKITSFNFTHLPPNFNGEVDAFPYRHLFSQECTGKLHSMYCSTHNHKVCIFVTNMKGHYVLISISGVRGSLNLILSIDNARSKKVPPSVVLSSTAYILGTGVQPYQLSVAHRVATLTVMRDEEVMKIDGTSAVTRVDVKLLLGTTSLLIVIYAGLIVVGVWGWWAVGKGREGYNGFCEVEDTRDCLWNEMKRKHGSCGKGEIRRNGGHLEFLEGTSQSGW